jgi:transmembrane sensor
MTDNSPLPAKYDAITDAASHWCLRLHAIDCTAQERVAFEQWRDAHPLHAIEYEAMLEIWEVAGELPRAKADDPAARSRPAMPWRRVGIAVAFCAVVLPLVAFSGWNLGWFPDSYQHFEASDTVRQVTLSDGTQVELNLGSELTFSHYKDQRRVTLKKGEAFFSVHPDTVHPFVVKAASGRIRVTGTRFNVWMYEDQVRVNLIEGSLLVTSNDDLPGNGLSLGPAMQARYSEGDYTPQISQTSSGDNALAWRSGKLIVDDLALIDVLPLINRYLSKPVTVADHRTGQIRLGGIYNIKDLNNLVASLPKVLPVYLTRNQDGNPVINSIPQQAPKS